MADVFRNLGYRTQVTKQTKDGGYDVLLTGSDDSHVLVECKRYSQDRRVSVETVRQLLGVHFRENVHSGKLVTTTYLTEPAKSEATRTNDNCLGFHLDLVDIEQLTNMLQVYNVALPPHEIARRFCCAT